MTRQQTTEKEERTANTVFTHFRALLVWASSLAFRQFTSGDRFGFVTPEKSVNTARYAQGYETCSIPTG